jgi:hypothetical protein
MSNQLELFKVLTRKQLVHTQNFIELQEKIAKNLEASGKITSRLLIDAGFEEGKDFIDTFNKKTVTELISIGSWNEKFENEITYVKSSGGVVILYNYYNESQKSIIPSKSSIQVYDDKIECYSISDNFRNYTPKGLYKKLLNKNKQAQLDFEKDSINSQIIVHTLNKYSKLYPEAKVTSRKEYVSGRGGQRGNEYDNITVEFKSGSTMVLRLGYSIDAEYMLRYKDTNFQNLTLEDKMNQLNNQ